MKNIKRIVSTGLWNDALVMNDFSPEDKYFLLYLLTNPHTTQLGIYYLPVKVAALELGYSIETIKVLLDRFENKYELIKFSESTSEVAIKNFLRHSIMKGGKPVYDCLKQDEKNVVDKELTTWVIEYLKEYNNSFPNVLNNTVKEFIDNFGKEESTKEEINDNDNDNDNERYVDVSQTRQKKANRFSNYVQRTGMDFDELEKRMMKRQ